MIRSLVLVILLLAPRVQASAQVIYAENQIPARGVSIEYSVTIRNPLTHVYEIEMTIAGIRDAFVEVSMPAWAPGAYTIRNYARNVQDFRALTTRTQVLKWEMTDKQTWRIAKLPADDVSIRYQVFSTNLTDQMADVSGPATFMYVAGQKHVPVSVKYTAPDGWKVYTGLDKRGDRYYASDYDIFIDAPAFIGEFKVLEFQAGGRPHYMVFSRRQMEMTDEQVVSDVKDIVDSTLAVFGQAPYKQYMFLIKVQPQPGSSGLEHLNSANISVGENDFVSQTAYRRFLFVAAHEYFHVWNVKRIRPKPLGPFDYSKEVHTRLLWFSEGVTDYYARLLLVRTGILTPQDYYGAMSFEINLHQHTPGRFLMSAEEASWNAWVRSDNAENNTISYYRKGEILGLLLDLEIRGRTSNQKSLDDVMRRLMENYADKGMGIPEEGVLEAVETVAGSDFKEFFAANIQGRQELDYNRYMGRAGLGVEVAREPSSMYIGVEVERAENNMVRIRRVVSNSPAERAKLDSGDIILAVSDERLTFDNFRSRLHSHGVGENIKLTVMRGERMLNLSIVPIEFQDQRWSITEGSRPEQIQFRMEWLGNN